MRQHLLGEELEPSHIVHRSQLTRCSSSAGLRPQTTRKLIVCLTTSRNAALFFSRGLLQ